MTIQLAERVIHSSRARNAAALGLVLSSLLVIALIVPWNDLQTHGHWRRVHWLPFAAQPLRPRDLIANVLLCAPIGVFSAALFRRWLLITLFLTLTLSVVGESAQIYSHTRYPSATDVTCNVAGALVAAAGFRRWRRSSLEHYL